MLEGNLLPGRGSPNDGEGGCKANDWIYDGSQMDTS